MNRWRGWSYPEMDSSLFSKKGFRSWIASGVEQSLPHGRWKCPPYLDGGGNAATTCTNLVLLTLSLKVTNLTRNLGAIIGSETANLDGNLTIFHLTSKDWFPVSQRIEFKICELWIVKIYAQAHSHCVNDQLWIIWLDNLCRGWLPGRSCSGMLGSQFFFFSLNIPLT